MRQENYKPEGSSYSDPDLNCSSRFPGNALHPCRYKKRGRQHQQRKPEKLSGTGKICRDGGKKDKVSFVVTHIDEDRNVAVGIIKQNSL